MTEKTIFGDMSEEQIRAEAGMGTKSTPSYIVNLRITNNHKDKNNDDKITQYLGSYNVWDKDTEQFVYAPPISFRPFMKRQQYMTWDNKDKTFLEDSEPRSFTELNLNNYPEFSNIQAQVIGQLRPYVKKYQTENSFWFITIDKQIL